MGKTIFGPPAGPPSVHPSTEIYGAMGEARIFAMLADFYDELGRSSIRPLFSDDLLAASKRSAAFFVGLLGGPPLYQQLYGHPMLRARHMPFKIDRSARDVWLACFEKTLEGAEERYHFPPEHLEGFRQFLREFSLWMINTP